MLINKRFAITFVETLVVVFIILVLMGLIIPAIQRVRSAADSLSCKNRLRQIGIGLHHYDKDYGHLPPGRYRLYSQEPQEILSWMVLSTPYYESDAILHDAMQASAISKFPNDNPPHAWLSKVPKALTCPSDSRLALPLVDPDGNSLGCASYLGILGSGRFTPGGRINDGMFAVDNGNSGIKLSNCPDGLSITLLLGERPPPDSGLAGQWYARMWRSATYTSTIRGLDHAMFATEVALGQDVCRGPFMYGPGKLDNSCDRYHFWSLHSAGAHFAFADSSVRFLRYSASSILPDLASRNGNEPVGIEE